MTVVQIGIVRVPVHQRRMAVPMGMRLARWRVRPMCVLMMLVVMMPVLVLQNLMNMFVIVPLGQMQP